MQETWYIRWMVVTDYRSNIEIRLGQNPETIYKFLLEPVKPIIKQTNPSYSSPLLLQLTKPPAKYSSHFCKYISSNVRHTSLEILSCHCWSYTLMTMTVMESLLVTFGMGEWICIAIVMLIPQFRLSKQVYLWAYISVIRQI